MWTSLEVTTTSLSLSALRSVFSHGKCGAASCASDDAFPLHTETLTVTHTLTCFCHTGGRCIARIPRRRTPTVTVNPSLNPWSVEVYLVEAGRFDLHAVSVWIDVLCVPHNDTQSAHTHTHTFTWTEPFCKAKNSPFIVFLRFSLSLSPLVLKTRTTALNYKTRKCNGPCFN